jgi:hypothetical protein
MKISLPVKIIIGLLTAWVVIAPFLYIIMWFSYIFSFSTTEYLTPSEVQTYVNDFATKFIPIFFLIICSSVLSIGLHAFYITHIILNKAGADVYRVIFGIGIIFLAFLAMPIYYFIYVLPHNPPQWALADTAKQGSTQIPVQPGSLPPNK